MLEYGWGVTDKDFTDQMQNLCFMEKGGHGPQLKGLNLILRILGDPEDHAILSARGLPMRLGGIWL